FASRVFECEPCDATRCAVGDDLQTLDYTGDHFVLEAGVEIFGVFADDDQIDVLVTAGDALHGLDGTQIRVEIKRFSQPHVRADEARPNRSRHRALERDLVSPD